MNHTKQTTIGIILSMLMLSLVPMLAFGATSGLIPCGNTEVNGSTTDPCTFNDLIALAQNIINFLIFNIAAPLATIMFAYAGFLYVTNAGNESQVKQAKDIFMLVLWGFVIALAAWLTVNMVINFFLDPSDPSLNLLGP